MPDFLYKAIDAEGRTIESEIVAPSENEVIKHLQKINLIPVNIKKKKSKIKGLKSKKKIRIKDIILFTKQFSTLLKSGVPILVSLRAIKEQSEDPTLIDLMEQITEEVNQGNALSSAMSQFPKIFPSIYVNSIKVGELSGTLEDTLEYLRKYLENEEQIRKTVKKALRYPVIVLLGIITAFVVFMTIVIPNFIPIFSASGMELPLPTRILISLSDIFTHYGLILLISVTGIITGLVFYKRTDKGRFYFDKFLLDVPIFGPLLKKVSISRFAKIFYTMNKTGIPVIQAFETMSSNADNEVYRREFIEILERIKEGDGIAKSLAQSSYFSSFVVEMIAIGEKSGALDDMLYSVSEFYDSEVNDTVNNMTSLIEPIVTVILGLMVLLLAMAIFLPMWDMMSIVQ
jgi:type II secretory pathway component PulF